MRDRQGLVLNMLRLLARNTVTGSGCGGASQTGQPGGRGDPITPGVATAAECGGCVLQWVVDACCEGWFVRNWARTEDRKPVASR